MIKCALQISKGAAQRGRTEGAVLPVRRSAPEHNPYMTYMTSKQHSTTARWIRLGVNFEERGNRSARRKPSKSGWDRLKLNPHTTFVVEVEGVIDFHYASLASRRVQQRVFYLCGHPSRYQPRPTGLNFGEQTGTGVFPLVIAEPTVRNINNLFSRKTRKIFHVTIISSVWLYYYSIQIRIIHRVIMIHPVSKTSRNWDSENIIFVVSVGMIFHREPFYFFWRFKIRYYGLRNHSKLSSFLRVWVFETPKGSEFLGSEFSRHPEGLSFKVWVFETPRGSEF